MKYTAAQIMNVLGLAQHPTCGFTRETYRSPDIVPPGILRPAFRGSRPLGSVLYFLVTPDASIQLHRVIADQMYHHYLGDPIEVLLLFPDGNGAVVAVGTDLMAGMRPQLLIPGGTYHIARVASGGEFALLGTTEWGGVESRELEKGNPQELMKRYPAFADQIESFTEPHD